MNDWIYFPSIASCLDRSDLKRNSDINNGEKILSFSHISTFYHRICIFILVFTTVTVLHSYSSHHYLMNLMSKKMRKLNGSVEYCSGSMNIEWFSIYYELSSSSSHVSLALVFPHLIFLLQNLRLVVIVSIFMSVWSALNNDPNQEWISWKVE